MTPTLSTTLVALADRTLALSAAADQAMRPQLQQLAADIMTAELRAYTMERTAAAMEQALDGQVTASLQAARAAKYPEGNVLVFRGRRA